MEAVAFLVEVVSVEDVLPEVVVEVQEIFFLQALLLTEGAVAAQQLQVLRHSSQVRLVAMALPVLSLLQNLLLNENKII